MQACVVVITACEFVRDEDVQLRVPALASECAVRVLKDPNLLWTQQSFLAQSTWKPWNLCVQYERAE